MYSCMIEGIMLTKLIVELAVFILLNISLQYE